jgi:hypothetical protein
MGAFTRWMLAHKLVVAGCWLIIFVVGALSTSSATNALSLKFDLPGQEGYQANLSILRAYGTDPTNPPFVPVVTLPAGVRAVARCPGAVGSGLWADHGTDTRITRGFLCLHRQSRLCLARWPHHLCPGLCP